jgi:predicted ATPase
MTKRAQRAGLDAYLRQVTFLRDRVEDFEKYPFSIPALQKLDTIEFHPKVTFFVGENGSGKSTLIEAIAVAAGFNPEGGTTNFKFSTRSSESGLHKCLRLARGVHRPRNGYFLRAESFFNVATHIEELDAAPTLGPPIIGSYGGRSLHEQSHGESFMALVNNRFGANGIYILDEPEAALSPQRQLALLCAIDRLARLEQCQFIIATHSPIILAYPDAIIFSLTADGLSPVAYEDTEHYALTRDFLLNRERYLKRMFADS